MIHESDNEHRPVSAVLACDETMRKLHERTFFQSGMPAVVNLFVQTYQPQSLDSFIPVAKLIVSAADYMCEPGDDSAVLQTTLIQGVATGLCVTNETYNGVMDIDDTLQSIIGLCTCDEHGRKNINQLVDKANGVVAMMSREGGFILADWRRDYQVQTGQEDVFDIGFAMVLAGAHEKALQRQIEQASTFDWDSLLGEQ